MIATIGKWKDLDVPNYWKEDFQEQFKSPNQSVYLLGDPPYWEAGFSISKLEQAFTKMKLIDALIEAEKRGYVLMEEVGFELD